jgi:hypothetical protein
MSNELWGCRVEQSGSRDEGISFWDEQMFAVLDMEYQLRMMTVLFPSVPTEYSCFEIYINHSEGLHFQLSVIR